MEHDIADRNTDEPPKAFFVMRATHWGTANQCYTDYPETVATFMWGRQLSEYYLWINDRIYDWPKGGTTDTIEAHLKHALEIDNAFYPPEEFPRYHWWE